MSWRATELTPKFRKTFDTSRGCVLAVTKTGLAHVAHTAGAPPARFWISLRRSVCRIGLNLGAMSNHIQNKLFSG